MQKCIQVLWKKSVLINDIDINILKENLEDYRIISMTILNYNKGLYKELFDTIYKLKNQK